VLLPLAARAGALRPAARAWPWVVAFGLLEMAGPWVLLGQAETRVSSGFAGLMIATVPIVGVVVARLRGDRNAFAPVRVLGLLGPEMFHHGAFEIAKSGAGVCGHVPSNLLAGCLEADNAVEQ
jgi:hypothetical protein